MSSNQFLPTYIDGETIAVKMLDSIIIDNILYKCSKKYRLSYWIAKELCSIGYCTYCITPDRWLSEELEKNSKIEPQILHTFSTVTTFPTYQTQKTSQNCVTNVRNVGNVDFHQDPQVKNNFLIKHGRQ